MLIRAKKIRGYLEINENLRFMQHVAMRYALPWSQSFFVDGINGSDFNNVGRTPTRAFATLTKALVVAGAGDVIYVRPKGVQADASDFAYYEDGATIVVPYKSVNLSIIGVTPHAFKPYLGPWLRHGYGGAEVGYVLDNYAPGLCLENLGFQAGDNIRSSYGAARMYASTSGGAYKTHAGSVAFSVYNCFFRDGQLTLNGGYDGVVDGCSFEASGTSNSGVWSVDNALPTGGHRIQNSHFNEMFVDNQTLRFIYFVAGQQVNFFVTNCRFGLIPADGHYMWFGGSNKGLVSDCHFQHDDVVVNNNDGTSEIYTADGGVIVTGSYDQSGLVTTA